MFFTECVGGRKLCDHVVHVVTWPVFQKLIIIFYLGKIIINDPISIILLGFEEGNLSHGYTCPRACWLCWLEEKKLKNLATKIEYCSFNAYEWKLTKLKEQYSILYIELYIHWVILFIELFRTYCVISL